MMMAIGLSQYNVALMNTVNHAFFKAYSIKQEDKPPNKKYFKPAEVEDIRYISELKGLFFSNPLLSLSLGICLFSMLLFNICIWTPTENKKTKASEGLI